MEKRKNVIKTLGVGALCLCGALTFAGCSNVDVSQKQADRAFEIAEKFDGFMDYQQQYNEKFEEYINSQSNRITLDEGWGIYKNALSRLQMNADNNFNNMRVKFSDWNGI